MLFLYLTALMELYVFHLATIFNDFIIMLLNTRNNGKASKLPKVKLDFARRSFYFLGASVFNIIHYL